MRIVFAGTPVFAAHQLEAVLDSGFSIIAAYTQPDRKSGRGQKLTPSPVKTLAIKHDIPVFQPASLKGAVEQEELASLQPDLMIVAAYGLILPQAVLDIPKKGCINVHASILPRWRGAAPIQHAILSGDHETGITIMQMDKGLDTGDMLLKRSLEISSDETAETLHEKLARLGAECLVDALAQFDSLSPEKQNDSDATYAHKIHKQDAQIDWQQPAQTIARIIRAYNPWPIAFTELSGDTVRIHSAQVIAYSGEAPPGSIVTFEKDSLVVACGEDALSIKTLQLPGGKPLSITDLYNSKRDLFKNACF